MRVRNCSLVRAFFAVLTCVAVVSLSGCVPLPAHGLLAGRGKIDEADIVFLKIGVTTREDVVLRFGEPDIVLLDQRILAYSWAVSVGVLVVPGGGDFPRFHIFMLEFDNEGRLKRAELNASGWTGGESRLEEWIKQSEDETIRGKSFK